MSAVCKNMLRTTYLDPVTALLKRLDTKGTPVMARNNAAFHGVTYDYEKAHGLHYLEAQINGEKVGSLNWEHRTGKISGVYVDPEHRRKKIATGMYNEAQRLSKTSKGIPAPKLTSDRTDDGEAWVQSLNKQLPKRK